MIEDPTRKLSKTYLPLNDADAGPVTDIISNQPGSSGPVSTTNPNTTVVNADSPISYLPITDATSSSVTKKTPRTNPFADITIQPKNERSSNLPGIEASPAYTAQASSTILALDMPASTAAVPSNDLSQIAIDTNIPGNTSNTIAGAALSPTRNQSSIAMRARQESSTTHPTTAQPPPKAHKLPQIPTRYSRGSENSTPDMIRMRHLHPSLVPYHSLLRLHQHAANAPFLKGSGFNPNLEHFVNRSLDLAREFAMVEIPSFTEHRDNIKTKDHKIKGYKYKGKEGVVKTISWSRTNSDKKETWAARSSRHQGISHEGDASFSELMDTLRLDHTENEKAYTPGFVDAQMVCEWEVPDRLARWKFCTMQLYENRHQVGSLLKDRVFSSLVITGVPETENKGEKRSFVVLTVPVVLPVNAQTPRLETSKYSDSKKIVLGAYCAVEHVYEDGDEGEIQWVMATASDAKGSIPLGIQGPFVPRKIANDVGYVMKWLKKKRHGEMMDIKL